MEVKIYTKENALEHEQFLEGKGLDVYYYPGFLKSEELLFNGQYEVFTVQSKEDWFIYPYIRLEFSADLEGHIDLTSPYGYPGPVSSSDVFFTQAEAVLLEHLNQQKVVSEFIRYHYLFNERLKFSLGVTNVFNRRIIVPDITQPFENIWKNDFSATNRNLINRMLREGYSFELQNVDENIMDFTQLYYTTMRNAGAQDFYFFSKEYFRNIAVSLKEKLFLARVQKEGVTYSQSLFFISGPFLTYFLSARNTEFPKVSATNMLLSEAIKIGAEKGAAFFNLGGGRTTSPDDALLKFKEHFSRRYYDFYIGKRVVDQRAYEHLVHTFVEAKGKDEFDNRKHLLHFYR